MAGKHQVNKSYGEINEKIKSGEVVVVTADEIIDIVRGLEEKSYAYEVDGDVYYRVEKFPAYGGLSNRTLEEAMAGARVEVDERKQSPWTSLCGRRSHLMTRWWVPLGMHLLGVAGPVGTWSARRSRFRISRNGMGLRHSTSTPVGSI